MKLVGFAGTYFGSSVGLSGNRAVIGAPGGEAAFVFGRGGADWPAIANLRSAYIDGSFGDSVSIDKNGTVVVGAMNEGDGKVYVFSTDVIFQDGFDP